MATHQARGRGVLALYHPGEALVGGVLREFGDACGDVAGAPVNPGKAAHGNGVDVVEDHGQRGRALGNARDLEGERARWRASVQTAPVGVLRIGVRNVAVPVELHMHVHGCLPVLECHVPLAYCIRDLRGRQLGVMPHVRAANVWREGTGSCPERVATCTGHSFVVEPVAAAGEAAPAGAARAEGCMLELPRLTRGPLGPDERLPLPVARTRPTTDERRFCDADNM